MKYILYRKRTFSEKFNLAFDWLRDNWRPLLRFTTVFLLPLSLLQGFGYADMTGLSLIINTFSPSNATPDTNLWMTLLATLCTMAGAFLSYSLFFALIRLSFIDGEDLNALSLRELWQAMRQNMGRLLGGGIFVGFVIGVVSVFLSAITMALGGVSFESEALGFVLVIAIVFFAVLLMPFYPVYILDEDTDSWDALQRSVRLGWKCCWGFWGAVAVMALLSYVLMGLGNVPMVIFLLLKSLVLSRELDSAGVFVDFFTYLSSVAASYVGFFVSVLCILILSIQTGHAADKIDGVSADVEIDDF